jgi:hypothetical protein
MKDVCLVCGEEMEYTLAEAFNGRLNICKACRDKRDKNGRVKL